jgi:acyl-CoA reductase-like NAD-dependent aldehyde dehydrogenase
MPIGDARGAIAGVAATFRYYAAVPQRLGGQTIPVAGGVDMTFREPIGVVAAITPWNFPLTIASWKVAPAPAAGNAVIHKPSELAELRGSGPYASPALAGDMERALRAGG